MSNLQKIKSTFITGRISATLVIPLKIAKEYGIDKPSDVIIEGTDKGILIRKLEI
ncbi:MAG: hypothetical protein WKF36_10815 [Candidatus Nitrosocosmicus sp.]